MNSKPGQSSDAEFATRFQGAIQLERQGRLADAVTGYRALLASHPARVEPLPNLGRLLLHLGQPKEACELLARASTHFPKSALVRTNYGLALALLGETKRAVANYKKAIAEEPSYVLAHFNLGHAFLKLKRYDEARASLETTVQLAPDNVDALCTLADLFLKRDLPRDAITCYRRALSARPHDPFILYNLGNAHLALAEPTEAIEQFTRALAIMPTHADAQHAMGLALQMLNRFAEAARFHAEAVRLAPSNGRFLRELVELGGANQDERLLVRLEQLADKADESGSQNRVHLYVALGTAYEKRGAHDLAFRHFLEANRRQRKLIAYDEAETDALFSRVRSIFTPQRLRPTSMQSVLSDLPVFIIGMPRSGSTLVEQILSSHSKVFGAGEVQDFSKAIESLGRGRFDSPKFLEGVAKLSPAQLASIAKDYIARLSARAPSAARITDKFLSNFLCIGLIHMILPNARFVHTVRNPLDVCVSRFTKVLVPGSAYSYDLGELGRYHRHYQKLMDHWRLLLPPGTLHEISYEELIAHPEEQIRSLLEYCGLEWEEACLQFHANTRSVGTPSRSQVRERLYSSSVGRWTGYRDHLAPLFAALEIAGIESAPPQ